MKQCHHFVFFTATRTIWRKFLWGRPKWNAVGFGHCGDAQWCTWWHHLHQRYITQLFYRKIMENSPSATKTKVSDDGQDTWWFDDFVFLVVGSSGVGSSRLNRNRRFHHIFGEFLLGYLYEVHRFDLELFQRLGLQKWVNFVRGEPSIPWVRYGYGLLGYGHFTDVGWTGSR